VVPDAIEALEGTSANNEQTTLEYDMITPDAFLVFLGAASLPVIYIFILSRWLEPSYRQAYPETTKHRARPVAERELVHQSA
jgi:hypothetical protein